MRLVVILFLVILLADRVSTKKMWGSRKKVNSDENEASKKEEHTTDRMSNRVAPNQAYHHRDNDIAKQLGLDHLERRAIPPSLKGSTGKEIEEMLNLWLGMMEDMVLSDDFMTLVTPESIEALLKKFPGITDTPEFAQIFEQTKFKDPAFLKRTVTEGIKLIRESSAEIIDYLSDPIKWSELLKQLPPELELLLTGLKSGDISGLQDIVRNLPGLNEEQKKLLTGALDGNTDAITEQLGSLFNNPNHIEAARLELLSSPEFAESFGIPPDLLQDPVRWAETMAQTMEALNDFGTDAGDAGDEAFNLFSTPPSKRSGGNNKKTKQRSTDRFSQAA